MEAEKFSTEDQPADTSQVDNEGCAPVFHLGSTAQTLFELPEDIV